MADRTRLDDMTDDALDALVAERDALAATIERVRGIHTPVQHLGKVWCAECSVRRSTGPKTEEWVAYIPHPCPTRAALDPQEVVTETVQAEYLYELWDANWDDGPLGNYQILRHPITKKTAKRIYFTRGGSRVAFVDRQRIEAAGEIFYRPIARTLYVAEPEIPHRPKSPSLSELRKAMADAHPDRGGSDEAFIEARERYERARGAAVS